MNLNLEQGKSLKHSINIVLVSEQTLYNKCRINGEVSYLNHKMDVDLFQLIKNW